MIKILNRKANLNCLGLLIDIKELIRFYADIFTLYDNGYLRYKGIFINFSLYKYIGFKVWIYFNGLIKLESAIFKKYIYANMNLLKPYRKANRIKIYHY